MKILRAILCDVRWVAFLFGAVKVRRKENEGEKKLKLNGVKWRKGRERVLLYIAFPPAMFFTSEHYRRCCCCRWNFSRQRTLKQQWKEQKQIFCPFGTYTPLLDGNRHATRKSYLYSRDWRKIYWVSLKFKTFPLLGIRDWFIISNFPSVCVSSFTFQLVDDAFDRIFYFQSRRRWFLSKSLWSTKFIIFAIT